MEREGMLENMLRLFTEIDLEALRRGDDQEYTNLKIRISNAKHLLSQTA